MSHKYPALPLSTRRKEIQPIVKEQFTENGTEYYRMVDGRVFDKKIYDNLFIPVRMQVLSKHYPIGTDKEGIGSPVSLVRMKGRLRK